jgi:predicted transcriptional regulator
MPSETVRIRSDTHAKLKELAEHFGRSMPQVLEEAIEFFRRQKFLEDANRAYAALRQNASAWAEEQAERDAWDSTLADDLEEQSK